MDFEERPKMNQEDRADRDTADHDTAEYERRLQFAIRRHEAPLGLKSRVLAQARARRRQAKHSRGWMLQRIAASTLLAVLFGGFAVYHQKEEQRKGEQAREQVMMALRITSKTLGKVNEHLADSAK